MSVLWYISSKMVVSLPLTVAKLAPERPEHPTTLMKKLLYLAALATLATGCSSNSTDPGTSNAHPLVSAKPGSTWNLEITQTDSTGANMSEPIEQFDSIVATGLDYMGKSGVVKVYQYTSSHGEQYGYYALESNGDLSFWLGGTGVAGIKTGWLRLPFGAGDPTTTVIFDSTAAYGPYTVNNHETATFQHTNPISLTVQGNAISADGVTGTFKTVTTSTVPNFPSQTITLPGNYYYWSRDIGFVAKSVLVYNDTFAGKITTTQTLLSYSLR